MYRLLYRLLEEWAGTQKYTELFLQEIHRGFATSFNTFSCLSITSSIRLVVFVRADVKEAYPYIRLPVTSHDIVFQTNTNNNGSY